MRRFAIEAAAVLALWLSVGIAIAAISTNEHWLDVLYTDGDSLVLPLFQQSYDAGHKLDWVFSSQFFLFPELPVYVLSTLPVTTVRLTLSVNAALNITIIYGLLRAIAQLLRARSTTTTKRMLVALGATLLLVLIVILEQSGGAKASALATPLFTSTYYVGAIQCGLAIVALLVWVSRGFRREPWGGVRTVVFIAATVSISTLAAFSDPLFIAWVPAPLCVAIVLVTIGRGFHWVRMIVVLSTQLLSVVIALRLRTIFHNLSTAPLDGYVHPEQFPLTVLMFQHDWDELTATGPSILRLVLLVALVLVAVIGAGIVFVRSLIRRRDDATSLFLFTFAAVSVVSVVGGTLITGTSVPRYMEPIVVFALLPLVLLGVQSRRRGANHSISRARRSSRIVLAAAAVAILVLSGATAPRLVQAVSGSTYTAASCFNDFVGDSKINGVGEYWVTRPLQLYGNSRGQVLQAQTVFSPDKSFSPMPWMINLADYTGKKFSYVVYDTGVHDSHLLAQEAVTALGAPRSVISCNGYTIYDFRGTPGEKALTEQIAGSLALLQTIRAQR